MVNPLSNIRFDELERRIDQLRIDLGLMLDRAETAERERDEALCRLDHAEADAEQAVSITISERDEARAEVERLKSRVQSISSSVEHHAKTAAASERAAIVAMLHNEAFRLSAQADVTDDGYDANTMDDQARALRAAAERIERGKGFV